VLLSAKLRVVRGAAGTMVRLTFWTVRGYIMTLVPWRGPDRRAISRRYAYERRVALTALLRSGRLPRMLRTRATELP
jgi:hypothetical protein